MSGRASTPGTCASPPLGRQARPAPRVPLAPCLQCGRLMAAISGSRLAVCAYCGFKDPCC